MTESLVELDELLMHHGMLSQVCDELLLLSCCRKFAMQESITTVCKVTLLCQLINVVPGIYGQLYRQQFKLHAAGQISWQCAFHCSLSGILLLK